MSAASRIKPSPAQVSTQVRMHLELGGEQLPVHQLGLDFAIVETATIHLPCAAKLMVRVDDTLTVHSVFLPEGIRPGTVRTPLIPG